MKANRNSLLASDVRGQVGIGTMIVFIATILVAATAAAVLIDTSGKLSERSSTTGNQATNQVASNLLVKAVVGNVTSGAVQDLNITIQLAPGAPPVDLAQMKILYTDGTERYEVKHVSAHDGLGNFLSVELRDPLGTHSASAPVLSKGGLTNLEINLDKIDGGSANTIGVREDISITLIPEVGAPVDASFTTPSSFGGKTYVVLR